MFFAVEIFEPPPTLLAELLRKDAEVFDVLNPQPILKVVVATGAITFAVLEISHVPAPIDIGVDESKVYETYEVVTIAMLVLPLNE